MARDLKIVFVLTLMCFVLALIPLVNAAPPVTTVTQFPQGLSLEYPAVEFLKAGEDFTFNFHVFNSSSGAFIITDTNCTFHLYNSTGNHIFQGYDDTVGDVYDYSFKILKGNFTNGGSYYYTTQCKTGLVGGYTEHAFEVKTTGVGLTEGRAILYIGLIAIFVLILLGIPFIINMLPASNARDDEGNIINVNYLKYFRSVLWFVEWMLTLALLFLVSNIAYAYLVEELFAQYLFTIFRIGMGITPVIVILWGVWLIAKIVNDKQIENLMKRGVFKTDW